MYKKTNKKEIFVIAAMITVALLVIAIMKFTSSGGSKVVVSYDGNKYASYDLNKDQEVEITTESGTNILKIKDGTAYMISASCPDKICMSMYPISDDVPGVIVCLPNHIIVEVMDE